MPPLPVVERPELGVTPLGPEVGVARREVDVVVIGGGESGRRAVADAEAAGRVALMLDAGDGHEVVAVYPGPTVVARTPTGMLHVHAGEIVVATGAAEIQPVCPGNDLSGLLTARAAARLHAPAWTWARSWRSGPHRTGSE